MSGLADAVGATDTSPAPSADPTVGEATQAETTATGEPSGEAVGGRAADGSAPPAEVGETGEQTDEAKSEAEKAAAEKAKADADKADAEKDKDDPKAKRIARALADMSRRETEMQRREKATKQLAADIATQRAAIETERKALASQQEDLKALARKNPVEAFEQLTGMKWDHAIARIASGEFDRPAPGEDVAELRAQIEAERRERESEKQRSEEERKAAAAEAEERRAKAVAEHMQRAQAECVKVAKSKAADFPLVNTYPDAEIAEVSRALHEAEHEAWELQHGKPLDFISLLGIMEARLEEQRDKLLRAKPVSPSSPADPKRVTSETAGTASQQPTTLTNDAASERSELKPAGKPGDFSHLDKAAASMRLWR